MPRPPIQHHKHIISLAPETEEAIDRVLDRLTVLKGIRAAGEVAKGILSHPTGFAAVGGLVAAFLIAYFVKPEPAKLAEGRDLERELIGILLGTLPIPQEEKDRATNNVLGAIRTIRKLLGLP